MVDPPPLGENIDSDAYVSDEAEGFAGDESLEVPPLRSGRIFYLLSYTWAPVDLPPLNP